MKHLWSTRKYNNGDEKFILSLFNSISKRSTRELDHWYWKFKDNPAGLAPIHVAEADGEIIGQYALMPLRMKVGQHYIIGAQSLDTMTHPNYVRQGIFIELANRVYREAKDNGISIVYGFPNEYSHPGFVQKLDWIDLGPVPKMIKMLDLDHFLKKHIRNTFMIKVARHFANIVLRSIFRSKRLPKQSDYTVNRIYNFDKRIDDFWQNAENDFNILTVRNQEYLNWRYVNHPEGGYIIYLAEINNKIFGFIVLKILGKEIKTGYIVDILTMPKQSSVAQVLVLKAIEHFRREKVNTVCCYILDNRYYQVLKQNGFRQLSSTLRLCVRVISSNVSKNFIFNTLNWHITFGDSDGI